ncbi:MAG TPA: hypothetical protein VK915_09225 [Gaiellaceae bacterium]|nr:hypothetical protein [Gaiellaceae bacterium]
MIGPAVVDASALGIDEREAREPASPLRRRPLQADGLVLRPQLLQAKEAPPPPAPAAQAPTEAAATLPERWEIQMDVYNGTRRGSAAASLANVAAGSPTGSARWTTPTGENHA